MGKSRKQQACELLVSKGCVPTQAEALVEAIEIMIGVAKKNGEKTESTALWDVYREAYYARYSTEPVRNATVNAQLKKLVERLGAEAPEVVKFYLSHRAGHYLAKCHPVGLCLADAEALRTQWARGRVITRNDVREFEKTDNFRSQLERIENGEL